MSTFFITYQDQQGNRQYHTIPNCPNEQTAKELFKVIHPDKLLLTITKRD